jgi:hypothetical protein
MHGQAEEQDCPCRVVAPALPRSAHPLTKEYYSLKVHLHKTFCSRFCTDQTHIGQIIIFFLEFADLFEFFNIRCSVDVESHSSSTESTPSETPRQLSQCRVRLHIN